MAKRLQMKDTMNHTEEQLKAMSKEELVAIATGYRVWSIAKTKPTLIRQILRVEKSERREAARYSALSKIGV